MESFLWSSFNSEDSWIPFLLPLAGWIASLVYCYSTPTAQRWHKWHLLHDIHNNVGFVMGWISLYFNNDEIFNERISILWSLAYFVVDLVDTVVRLDGPFVAHAVLTIALGIMNYTRPLLRELRMNSRAVQAELSTPFLYLSQKTRKPLHFVAFALAFTLARIIHVPVNIILPLIRHGYKWTDLAVVGVCLFYALNWYWYLKIWRILLRGSREEGKTKGVANGDQKDSKKKN
jgi:hypothetical protein